MASRRLAISSLLCDDADSSNRPPSRDSHLSRSPAISPQLAGRPYASPIRGAFVPTRNPYDSGQNEQQYSRPAYEHSPSPQSPPPYAPSPSTSPLPRAQQSFSYYSRSPSPLPISPAVSPPAQASVYRGRYIEDEQVPSSLTSQGRAFGQFPVHTVVQQTYATQPIQPIQYSHYSPPPPSASPIITSGNNHEEHATFRGAPVNYSPLQRSQPVLSVMSNQISSSPPHLQPISTSYPPHLIQMPTFPRDPQRSPVFPPSHPLDERASSSHLVSTSMSPTFPKAAPSGLDVLVQAATEERERIDVNRRVSGGEEWQASTSLSASRPSTLSPIAFRTDMRPRPTSPKPLPSPSTTYSHHPHPSPTGMAHYEQRIHVEEGRAVKRRRSSPKLPPVKQDLESHPAKASEMITYGENDFPRGEDRSCELSHAYAEEERKVYPVVAARSSPTVVNYAVDKVLPPRSTPAHPATSSARSLSANHPRSFESLDSAIPSSRSVSDSVTSIAPAHIPHGRRSPPRSRPKPKKPGSAALAVMEREFKGVALSEENGQKQQAKEVEQIKLSKAALTTGLAETGYAPMHPRPLSKSGPKRPDADEWPTPNDQDAHDFFLSVFDSPSLVAKAKPQSNHRVAGGSTLSTSTNERRLSGVQYRKGTEKARQSLPSRSMTSRSPTPHSASDNTGLSPLRQKSSIEGRSVGEMEDVDAELENDLADAIGAVTSGDEGREPFSDFDDPETEGMEVDVEDELLSLVDGPLDHRSHHAPTLHPNKSPSGLSNMRGSADFDRMSMPPPDILHAVSSQVKDSKKGTVKSKGKGTERLDNATGSAKSGKKRPTKLEDSSEKVKAKPHVKPRPPKVSAQDKGKTPKPTKEAFSPMTGTPSSLPIPISNASTPINEAFPTVTSSGRMVTKSKKSAAAAASATQLVQGKRKPVAPGGGDASESRSRSHSVMPRGSVDPEVPREKSLKLDEDKIKEADEAEADDDDKLYCICKTKYDEDRVMIACDRCDDWYHTQCVNMPDLVVDLVDQFICPVCVARNPGLQLRTTYKQRCFTGLNDSKPNSSDACHKPSRGAYSKYCSDACGVKFMHRKVQAWANKGGSVQSLWETVKDKKRREGVVHREPGRTLPKTVLAELQNGADSTPPKDDEVKPKLSLCQEDIDQCVIYGLETQLQNIVQEREARKKEMEVVIWREKLLRLAAERADRVQECGWDQRLCFGDEEWLEFGEGVLESYEETTPNGHGVKTEVTEMDVDEDVVEGEWWCNGKKKCERHAGWQKLRSAEVSYEKESKEEALVKLTTREREIRSRIEDVLHPHSRVTTSGTEPKFVFKAANGILGRKGSEDGMKRGKKRTTSVA